MFACFTINNRLNYFQIISTYCVFICQLITLSMHFPSQYKLLYECSCCQQHYKAIMKYVSNGPLMLDVHMHKPQTNSKHFMDALLAFWPGLQVSVGRFCYIPWKRQFLRQRAKAIFLCTIVMCSIPFVSLQVISSRVVFDRHRSRMVFVFYLGWNTLDRRCDSLWQLQQAHLLFGETCIVTLWTP